MQLSKEQVEAAFDALSAPAREKRERLAAVRDLKRRRTMPLRWRLNAVLAGISVGAVYFWTMETWFIAGPGSLWAVTVCMAISVNIAQARWNKRVKT